MQFTLRFDPAYDLAHARERVAEDDAGKWDRLVPRRQIACWNGRLSLPSTVDLPADAKFPHGTPLSLTPTPWATGQLCQRLGIPTAYFRRCPPAVQDVQLNYWLHARDGEKGTGKKSDEETWLLRGKGATLRGLLSERYSPLDNAHLLDSIAPVLDDQFQVSGFSLTDESLHLRVIHPQYAKDIRPNDRLVVGLHLANSEVGCRAVTIDALVFRLVCANGLVSLVKGKSLLYRRHVGLGDPATFQHVLGQAVSRALVSGLSFMERLSWTARTYLPRMDETIAALTEQWGLSGAMQERILTNLLAEPAADQELLWSLINAITLAAQSLPPDDRYDLEVKAGQLAEQGFTGLAAKALPGRHRLPSVGAPEPGPLSGLANGRGLPLSASNSNSDSNFDYFQEVARDYHPYDNHQAGPVLGRA